MLVGLHGVQACTFGYSAADDDRLSLSVTARCAACDHIVPWGCVGNLEDSNIHSHVGMLPADDGNSL
jgi:hypothetical protein